MNAVLMSSYRRHEGHVVIDKYDLAARCDKCGKALIYPKPMPLDTWKEILQAFIRKHRKCGETPLNE